MFSSFMARVISVLPCKYSRVSNIRGARISWWVGKFLEINNVGVGVSGGQRVGKSGRGTCIDFRESSLLFAANKTCLFFHKIRTTISITVLGESATLHALCAENVFTWQRALHAYVLTWQCVLRVYVPTCQRSLFV